MESRPLSLVKVTSAVESSLVPLFSEGLTRRCGREFSFSKKRKNRVVSHSREHSTFQGRMQRTGGVYEADHKTEESSETCLSPVESKNMGESI